MKSKNTRKWDGVHCMMCQNDIEANMCVCGTPVRSIDEFDVVGRYVRLGSVRKVAKEIDWSSSRVHQYLVRKGISRTMDIDVGKVKKLYNEGNSQKEIAEFFGCSQGQISKIMLRNNLVCRTEKSTANVDVFENIDTEEKAYWLGMLAADGSVSKNNLIQLSLIDSDGYLVDKFASFVGVSSRNNRGMRCVQFKSIRMAEDLKRHGFTNNKSFELKQSRYIPEHLERHYWRGFFDGDGTISKNRYEISIISTKEMCDSFRDFAEKHEASMGRTYEAGSVFRVSAYGAESKKILTLLYESSKIFLERKKLLAEGKMTLNKSGVFKIPQNEARAFLSEHHYLKSLPVGCYCYGYMDAGVLTGVAAIGSLSSSAAQKKYGVGAYELRRFCLSENVPNLASKFLAAVIRELKGDDKIKRLISYADGAQGHCGTIYKAVGMKEVRRGKSQIGAYTEDGAILTGSHLQKYIQKHGNAKLAVVPGKTVFVKEL